MGHLVRGVVAGLAAASVACTGDPCLTLLEATTLGTVSDPRVDEASGLAWGGGDTFWVHNDDGDPDMFVVNSLGEVLAVVRLGGGFEPVDIEDVAMRYEGGQPAELLVGDIGGESGDRESIGLYRLDPTNPVDGTVNVTYEVLNYPDGEDRDAEALLVDPTDGTPYIVTQEKDDTARIFRSGPDIKVTRDLEDLGTLDVVGGKSITAGDVSVDGAWVALRSSAKVWLWARQPGQDLAAVFATQPCELDLAVEPQGESLAFDPTGFVTLSEGASQPLLRYDWP